MKKLLNKLLIVLGLFSLMQIQGQTFDFESSKGGWDAGFQMTSAELDATDKNTLKCVRENNNATITLNSAIATIDPTTKNFLRLVVKNESNATQFRIKAETTDSSDKTMNFSITANDTSFKTYLFDLNTHNTWNNATTTTEEITLLFRSGYNVSEGSIYIDEITFYNSLEPLNRVLPADSYFYNPTINEANQRTLPAANVNSATELQTLIDELTSLSGGGVLNINAGTYSINTIIHIKSNVHIRVDPSAILKTTVARGAMFQAGYASSYTLAENWSIQSTNGVKFTFDFEGLQPLDKIRAIQLGNTTNFKISDFLILDNFTKFNGVSSGAVGDADVNGDYTQGSAKFASFGIIENLDIKKGHYGYGLIQCQVGQDMLFRNLSGEGGVTLRFESGFEGLANRYLQDNTPTIERVYGRDISCKNGAHALMISPHTITQGVVDVRDITGISCESAVSAMFGFLSESKGQKDSSGNPLDGHAPGTFSEESVVTNVSATFGTKAQVRNARLKFVPCTLKSYISVDKNLDDESYESPALAAVLYLALEDYTSFNSPAGRYQFVLDNVSQTGFSSEVRADGLITDNDDDDFNGCATYTRNLTVADGNWSNTGSWEATALPSQGELKTIAHNIIINSDVVSDAPITINESKTLTITSGNSLTLNSDIVTNNGLILEHGAQLIITGKSTGNVAYKRTLTSISDGAAENKEGWFSISPPVSGEVLDTNWANANALALGSNSKRGIATYLENLNEWSYFSGIATTFVAGKGYIVKRSINGDVTFTGTLNTNDLGVNINVLKDNNGFNLLGNPYTSKINSATFIEENKDNLEVQQIWIWNDDGNFYEPKTKGLNFMLSPGQGFFIQSKNAATLNFSESNQEIGSDTFLKEAETKIRLKIANGMTTRYADIYYLDSATKGYDEGYEGEVFGGIADSFSLYTHLLEDNVGKKYQIQALPSSDFESMVIPIGVKTDDNSEFTFTLDANNIPSELKVFIEDKQENKFIELSKQNTEYKVNLTSNVDQVGRFYLHTNSNALSTVNSSLENINVFQIDDLKLKITGLEQEKILVTLYNTIGKQVLRTSISEKETKEVLLPKLSSGIYLIKLETVLGGLNKKIIIN